MRGRQLRLTDFSGGLNLRDDPVDLPPEQSPNATDMRPLGKGGGVGQRAGDKLNVDYSAVSPGTGFFPLFVYRAGPRILIPTTTNALVERQLSLAPAAPTQLEAAGSGSGTYAFVEAPASGGQGPIYFIRPSGGGRIARYWTGAGATAAWTASAGTLPDTARFLLYAGNRVWAARTTTAASSLFWSELGDPRNWPAANVAQFDPFDGEEITGIGTVRGQIVVFKETKAFVVYDLDTGANRPLGYSAGNDARGNVLSTQVTGLTQETPIGLVFSSAQHGWMVTDGISVKSIADILNLSTNLLVATGVAYFDGSLFIAYGGSAFYEFDLETQTWWRHGTVPGLNIIGLAVHEIDDDPILFASGRSTNLDELLGGGYTHADGSAAVAPRWTLPYMAFGSERQKRIRAIEFRGKGTVTFTATKDYQGTSLATRGPFTRLDGELLTIPTLGVARGLQLQLDGSGTTAADELKLYELVIYADGRAD